MSAAPVEDFAPGVYADMDEATYHGDPVPEGSLSSSGCKLLLDCPARFAWEREHPTVKRAFDVGTAAHREVLGVGVETVIVEGAASNGAWTTNAAKAHVAEIRAAGKTPVKPEERAAIDAMRAKLIEHPTAAMLFRDGTAETSIFWRDDPTKVMLRARIDWLTYIGDRLVIVDYKTTDRTANPARFRWTARDLYYHLQDAHYREGAAVTLDEDPAFVFVVQEKSPPYLVSVVELGDNERAAGADLARLARDRYLACRTSDDWPGYPPDVQPLTWL